MIKRAIERLLKRISYKIQYGQTFPDHFNPLRRKKRVELFSFDADYITKPSIHQLHQDQRSNLNDLTALSPPLNHLQKTMPHKEKKQLSKTAVAQNLKGGITFSNKLQNGIQPIMELISGRGMKWKVEKTIEEPRGFNLKRKERGLYFITYMHRYGLVHTWHLENLKNKNRSAAQASRDDETLPPRSGDKPKFGRKTSVSGTHHQTLSNASQDSHSSIPDVDCPIQMEIIRARREMQAAQRRMEKTQVDLEEAEIRMQALDLSLIQLAGSKVATHEERQEEIENLSWEIIQLRQDLDSISRQVSQKESLLTCAQQRKSSL